MQAKLSRVEVEELNWFNPNLDFRWFILPNPIGTINFLMGMIITWPDRGAGTELGTFDQMLISPASPVEIACGKPIPGCVVGLVHGTIFFFSIIGFFKVPFVGSVAVLYDHAAVLAFGEQHRALWCPRSPPRSSRLSWVLHRGAEACILLGIRVIAREQHADVLAGSEPA